MTRLLICFISFFALSSANAQIVITSADMPVAGDTLRYSNASPLSTIDLTTTGPATHWHFLIDPVSQAIDTYKKAYQVNPSFATSISLAANGYRVADSIPGLSFVVPNLSVRNVYSFFETLTTPNAYATTFMAATFQYIIPFPITLPIHYTQPDAIYFFPLNYLREDSSDFELNFVISLASVGIKQKGYRKTKVDGWGEIMTPYFSAPRNCIRIRSEIHEVDSVILDTVRFGIPRTTIEYKWLVNGEHYPAMWVTASDVGGFEAVTSIKFRDYYRPELDSTLSVTNYQSAPEAIAAYPTPAVNGIVTLNIPSGIVYYKAELFDVQSRLVGAYENERNIDISAFASGRYIARITAGDKVYYAQIVK
jgi:hypothetical protein